MDENLVFKTFNEDEFFHDLASNRTVITNGGFTLISEALYLKKPILSIPVKTVRTETQHHLLEKLGYGDYSTNPPQKTSKNSYHG